MILIHSPTTLVWNGLRSGLFGGCSGHGTSKLRGLPTPSRRMKRRSMPMVSDIIAALPKLFCWVRLFVQAAERGHLSWHDGLIQFDFSSVPGYELWCLLVHLLSMVPVE